MTLNGFLQLGIYFSGFACPNQATRDLHGQDIFWRKDVPGEGARSFRAVDLSDLPIDEHASNTRQPTLAAMLMFGLVGLLVLYGLQRLQYYLSAQPPRVLWRGAGSGFQYGLEFHYQYQLAGLLGESTMSYLVQMAGLAFHNFVSAATGIVLAIAFIRGIARREAKTLGNFWVDLTRTTLYVLLPFCIIGALLTGLSGSGPELQPIHKSHTRRAAASG